MDTVSKFWVYQITATYPKPIFMQGELGPENLEQGCSMKRWTDLLLVPHVGGCLVGLRGRRLTYGG